jgi:hypothetical protein
MKTIAIIATLILASCAEFPVAVAVQGDYGTYSYSAKRGVEIAIDATK